MMLKSKRQTALDKAAAEAKPVATEQSSADLTAVISQLQAKRNAAEDRMAQMGEQRHKMLVDGAPDAAIDELRQEHRDLETSIDDLQAAIRIAEQRREAALVRERREAFERRGAELRAEVPRLEGDYAEFLRLGGELATLAEKIAGAEAELRGFNTEAVERKRGDLRISNHARSRAGGGNVDAPLKPPERLKDETDSAFALRVANLQMRHGDRARRGEVFRVLAARLIEGVGRIGFSTTSPRPFRLVETLRHVKGGEYVEVVRDASTGAVVVEKPVVASTLQGVIA